MIFLCPGCRSYTVVSHLNAVEIVDDEILRLSDNNSGDPTYLRDIVNREMAVRFHIINTPYDSVNYSFEESHRMVTELLDAANKRLAMNASMSLFETDPPEVLDTRIKLLRADLSSRNLPLITFHTIQDGYYIKKGKTANRFDEAIVQQCVPPGDSVINVLIMSFDPEQLMSGYQPLETTGVALSNNIKLAGLYQSGQQGWAYAGLLNHEIGHVLSLRHTWSGNDGCDDTPRHDNCWISAGDKKCSNNLMDYNAHQSAITPCQVARMHQVLSRPGSRQRAVLEPEWCDRNAIRELRIEKDELWIWPRDLDANVVVTSGNTLHIATSVSMPARASIRVENNARLLLSGATLYQACGRKWQGIRKARNATIVADRSSRMSQTDIPINTN